jgi:hypothetical protein
VVDLNNGSHTSYTRPIDMVGKTPAARNENGTPGGMAQLCRILEELTDKVHLIDRRVTFLEEQNLKKETPREAFVDVAKELANQQVVDTLTARMDLLENALIMVRQEAQTNKMATAPPLEVELTQKAEPKIIASHQSVHSQAGGDKVEIGKEKIPGLDYISPLPSKSASQSDSGQFLSSTPKSASIDDVQVKRIQDMIQDTRSMLQLEIQYPQQSDSDPEAEGTSVDIYSQKSCGF